MKRRDEVFAHFHVQADACDRLGSPFTATVCRTIADLLDEDCAALRRARDWSEAVGADALALRFCGALHALVLAGTDERLTRVYPPNVVGKSELAPVLLAAIRRHDAVILAALDQAPQTNEVARSAMLLPGFLEIARRSGLPLDLNEIGSSAGLNLAFDRYRYRYGDRDWGVSVISPVLAPDVEGLVPLPAQSIAVAGRHGCDVRPADITLRQDRIRLKSYIWPDQPDRLARLDAASDVARSVPFAVEAIDAAAFVEARLAQRESGRAFVLFHSIVWQYLEPATHQSIETAMVAAGTRADGSNPVFWLRMEGENPQPHAGLRLTSWPGGETVALAHCDYHGRWIRWLDG